MLQRHVTRRDAVLADPSACRAASLDQSAIGVVDDQFLTEDVDILTRTAREANPVRVRRSELHTVADFVTPQPIVRGDEHCIGPAAHDPFERDDAITVAELEEGPVVEHQQHIAARGVVGQRKNPSEAL